MKREIKFRVFCEKHSEWEYYSIGDLICGSTTSTNGEGGIFKAETWTQFTGLQDQNGKDIYEGDILSYDYADHSNPYPEERKKLPCYIVKYDGENYFLLGGFGIDKSRMYCHSSRFKHTEIIGNIYENPELIKQQHEK